MMRYALLALLALLAPLPAPAQTPPALPPPPGSVRPAPGPSLDLALKLARATLEACHAKSFDVAASVVDSAGKAKATLTADGFGGNPATSVKKGAAAALFKAPGSQMEKREAADPNFARLVSARAADINVHAGSVPLLVEGMVIGGIGVTGAPTHEDDEACANAALHVVLPRGE